VPLKSPVASNPQPTINSSVPYFASLTHRYHRADTTDITALPPKHDLKYPQHYIPFLPENLNVWNKINRVGFHISGVGVRRYSTCSTEFAWLNRAAPFLNERPHTSSDFCYIPISIAICMNFISRKAHSLTGDSEILFAFLCCGVRSVNPFYRWLKMF
jgi:hypothetical protein